jgi:DNA-binding CsgD family transcriptional regulator
LFGAADALREAAGVTLPPPHRAVHEPRVAAARAALRPEAFESAWAAGRAMSLEQAVGYALQDVRGEGRGAGSQGQEDGNVAPVIPSGARNPRSGRSRDSAQAPNDTPVTPPRNDTPMPPPASRLPATGSSPLTAREREVAALVARGFTNRQIAEALVITEGTAGSHLEHILAKLGFRSRAQIAAWAVARGLPPTRPE